MFIGFSLYISAMVIASTPWPSIGLAAALFSRTILDTAISTCVGIVILSAGILTYYDPESLGMPYFSILFMWPIFVFYLASTWIMGLERRPEPQRKSPDDKNTDSHNHTG